MCGIFHDFPYDGWFAAGHQTSISPIQAADCPDGMAVSYLKCDGRRGPLRSVGYLLELLEMWIFVSSFVTNSSSHQQPSASPQPVTHSWGIATTCGCIAGSLCSGSYLSAFHTYAHPWPSIAASKSSKAGGNDGGSGSDRLVQWRAGSHGLPWWKGLGTQVITKDGSLDECW